VLHAPTPTDERLSLPARLLATIPVEASRRRLMPGAATDACWSPRRGPYPEMVLAVRPEHRTLLVPLPDFPKSEEK